MPVSINTIDTANQWMVDSSHIYIPSTPCKVEHSNVVGADSGRDESGLMHIDWVARDKRKVFLHYNAMSASELTTMLNLLQGEEFSFKFLDHGTVQTMDAYCGECNYQFYTNSSLYTESIYTDVEFHVIEM